jgi:hypothetical protein
MVNFLIFMVVVFGTKSLKMLSKESCFCSLFLTTVDNPKNRSVQYWRILENVVEKSLAFVACF